MKESEIKSLLENIEVTPSARCWDAIEGNLAAVASTSSAAGKAAAGKSAAKLSASAVKVTVGASIAAVVTAGAIICGVMLTDQKEQKSENTSKPVAGSEKIIEKSENFTTETATAQIENVNYNIDETVQTINEDMGEKISSTTATIPTNTIENEGIQNATLPTPTTFTPISNPSPAPSNFALHNNTTTSSSTTYTEIANTPPTTIPNTTTAVTLSTQTDPVLEGRNDIETSQPISVEIPNVITPNGDGFNDLFVIKGIEHCENSKLIIRNRSGVVVFQTSDYQNNWNAENAADGSYYYQFFYRINGIQQTRTGMLTIIR